MKKSLLYGIILTTALMSSCKGDYDDWAAPQGYEPDEAKNVTVTAVAVPAIDMNNVSEESVQMFTATVDAPEGMEVVAYKMEIAKDGETKQTFDCDANGSIATADLVTLTESFYGKAPVQRTLKTTVIAYLKQGGQALYARSNEVDNFVTLITPDISENYYLVGDMFGDNGWSEEGMQKFNHSDVNIYDDPVFTISFETTAENQYWKIIPQKNIDNNDFWADPGVVGTAIDGDTSMSGFLVTTGAKAGKIEEPGKYNMTINMLDGTYTIEKAPTALYLTGSNYNWGGAASDWIPLTPIYGSDVDYWTIIYLHADEQVKFAPQAGWGGDFGGNVDVINDVAGAGAVNDNTNLKIANAGWYMLHIVNGATRKVEILEPNVYLMGDAAGEWNIADIHKFTIPATADGTFESPAFADDCELRMCVSIEGFDWWMTEFMIFDGKIDFRGRGGDQARVNVAAGQKAYLNFTNGTGEIK